MKKLPIGISTLREILEEDYLYIDKTKIALELIESGKYYFLSRPRRFGKSLFLDTLRTIFEGDKEIFEGLYIYDKYEFVKHPIIRISFNSGDFKTKEGFEKRIFEILRMNQRELDLSCDKDLSVGGCLEDLIYNAYKKYNQRVVILIDEYDKPILDNIEEKQIARERREDLKNFYSVIKGSDEYIKLVFITGVSKFSKISLFSGLNNLNDITLNPRYATICGYTQNDIETTFINHLQGQEFSKIARWYNGYRWLGESVYNPFDILLFISNGFKYRNYWFSTATPTFLLKLIEQNRYFLPSLEMVTKDDAMLDSFDVDDIELETLMWQTGYLTIESSRETQRGEIYTLVIPNLEVQISLLGSIAKFMSKVHQPNVIQDNIYNALTESDFPQLQKQLTSLYASIPYNLFTKNKMYEYEGYYVSLFYAYMKALGVELIGEDVTNKGRIDLTLKLPNAIYIIEFKTDGSNALAQIEERRYHEKYLGDNLPIFLVGIEFDVTDRSICGFEWMEAQIAERE